MALPLELANLVLAPRVLLSKSPYNIITNWQGKNAKGERLSIGLGQWPGESTENSAANINNKLGGTMKPMRIVQATLAASLLAISSSAVATTYTGAFDTVVPDAEPSGIASTISIADAGSIAGLTLDLTMDHTWVGDLIIILTSAEGTTITLMNRPGSEDPNDVGADVDT